ncbi:FAD-dependent oxidoreductase [Nocardioides sp. AE5]|uniref:NAD(P)/FAD-dependent oxidoreductase n=1 Tax=Nocardioides sp. AE5 TaxID=2962573 RepID=UPI0028822E2C|nr:FAD-dependent oxidoreductase [Nocardioides sp. AE5]MDT0203094.1 FAD-dependent oxidoreductase [Nocardioides sp. AE5]
MSTPTDPSIETIAIVGAGLAGVHAAEELRARGYQRRLLLIGAEPHLPYDRPPLSKEVMLGKKTLDDTELHPEQWYADREIQVLTDHRITALDLAGRRLRAGEESFDYDRLLLACGSRARRLAGIKVPGVDVRHLRTREDALGLKERLGGRLLIIGGGWIGLELAAAARTAGGEVVLVETASRPLAGVLGPQVAEVFADLHRSHGVDLRTGTTVETVERAGERAEARFSDGSEVLVDTVVVAIGAEPETTVAEAAGLRCSGGIDVDAALRTSDPFVFAAGDVANHDHLSLGRLRVEHWDNAIAQGKHVAGSLLGEVDPYTAQPYFFTDQYDLGMEYVGHVGAAGHDAVHVRGDLASRVFTAYWTRGDRVVAGMHAGDWDAITQIRELVGGPASALPA